MAYFENGEFGLLRNLLRDPLSEVRDPLLWGPAVALRPAPESLFERYVD